MQANEHSNAPKAIPFFAGSGIGKLAAADEPSADDDVEIDDGDDAALGFRCGATALSASRDDER